MAIYAPFVRLLLQIFAFFCFFLLPGGLEGGIMTSVSICQRQMGGMQSIPSRFAICTPTEDIEPKNVQKAWLFAAPMRRRGKRSFSACSFVV
ncbi:MAG: hypothetical protein IKZ21_01820 [Clostridia bacterium]|nr:hypothetical protein [Clostridia bacterium]